MELKGSYYQYLIDLYPNKRQFLDWIKNGLDNRVYNYGCHLKYPFENIERKYFIKQKASYIKHHILDSYRNATRGYEGSIISDAYSTVNIRLSSYGNINVLPMPWRYGVGVFSQNKARRVINRLSNDSIKELLSDSFYEELMWFYDQLKQFVKSNNIKMIICYNDMLPLDRMIIDAGKESGIPTAVFLHGLPGRYDIIDDNRADYLFVWGESIKKQYVRVGVDSQKIYVTGHPVFSNQSYPKIEDFNFSAPLVLTYVGSGVPSDSTTYYSGNRGVSIIYPMLVEEALNRAGVHHAVLRPHPSENPSWYKNIVNLSFYSMDTLTLTKSIARSSLIIGPTSTVAMDAAIHGIPFFGFSPYFQYVSPLVPPFDDSEDKFPVAHTIEELVDNLRNGRYVDSSVFYKYISDSFKPEVILSLIQE